MQVSYWCDYKDFLGYYTAIPDRISVMFNLYYSKAKVFRPNGWTTKYIQIYQIAQKSINKIFPEIDKKSYTVIITTTLNYLLEEYKDNKISGNYIPIFPAIQKFEFIAVDKLPNEIVFNTYERYDSWVLAPFTMEQYRQVKEDNRFDIFEEKPKWEKDSFYKNLLNFTINNLYLLNNEIEKSKVEECYDKFKEFIYDLLFPNQINE